MARSTCTEACAAHRSEWRRRCFPRLALRDTREPGAHLTERRETNQAPISSLLFSLGNLKTSCLFPDAEDGNSVGDPCTAPSPIIAWIADGYPMLGPCECLDGACTQVVEMLSSYVLAGGDDDPDSCAYQDYTYTGDADEHSDGDQYLDECSGHYGPAGDYHYHMTNEYPWTLRCYRGTPPASGPGSAIGQTYNAGTRGSDCCFEKQCIDGVYQSGVSCTTMTCAP